MSYSGLRKYSGPAKPMVVLLILYLVYLVIDFFAHYITQAYESYHDDNIKEKKLNEQKDFEKVLRRKSLTRSITQYEKERERS